MVKGLPTLIDHIPPRGSCIIGKHQRHRFPITFYRARDHVDIVHTCLCGRMQIESIHGNFYFLTLIDDFSKNVWVYFIKHKFESFTRFKEFKSNIEK